MVELMGTTLENAYVYRDVETVSVEEFKEWNRRGEQWGVQDDGIRVYELEWRDKRPGAKSWSRHIYCRLYTKRRAGSKAFKSLVYEIKRAEPDTFGGVAAYRLVNSKSVYYKDFEPVL